MDREFARDTSPEARRVIIDGLRRMTPTQKLARLVDLNRSVEIMARAGIQARHPDATPKERKKLMARHWLDSNTLDAVVMKIDRLSRRS